MTMLEFVLLQTDTEWSFNPDDWSYRRGDEILTQQDIVDLRDEFVQQEKEALAPLFALLWTGEITLLQWEREFRHIITRSHLIEYALGLGGLDKMTQEDFERITNRLLELFEYEYQFALAIANGEYSEEALEGAISRGGLYIATAVAMAELAKVEGNGIPALSQYPGDGNTQCQSNCRCWLELRQDALAYYVTWRLDSKAKHCDDCKGLGDLWNPLVIPKV